MDTKNLYKNKLLETFDLLVDFLENNHINWFGAYGTGIGTIRHKGLIPWDDDFDLYVLRSDYEKLYSIRHSLKSSGLCLLCSRDGTHYNSFFKVVNENTTIMADPSLKQYDGIFIDIFPLDEGNEELFDRYYHKLQTYMSLYKLMCMSFNMKDIVRFIKDRKIHSLSVALLRICMPSYLKVFAHRRIADIDRCIKLSKGGNYISYYGRYKKKEILQKDWFQYFELYEYENRKMRLPKGITEYLNHMYGDFMKVPDTIPEYTHLQIYTNLSKKLSVNEVLEKVEDGIYFER